MSHMQKIVQNKYRFRRQIQELKRILHCSWEGTVKERQCVYSSLSSLTYFIREMMKVDWTTLRSVSWTHRPISSKNFSILISNKKALRYNFGQNQRFPRTTYFSYEVSLDEFKRYSCSCIESSGARSIRHNQDN